MVTRIALDIFSLYMSLHRIKSRKVFVAQIALFLFYCDQSFSFFWIFDWCFMVGYFDHMTIIRFQFTITICLKNSNAMPRNQTTLRILTIVHIHIKSPFILAIQNRIYVFVYRLCLGFVCITSRVPSLYKCRLVRLGLINLTNIRFNNR